MVIPYLDPTVHPNPSTTYITQNPYNTRGCPSTDGVEGPFPGPGGTDEYRISSATIVITYAVAGI